MIIYVGMNRSLMRIKATVDKDCLPADIEEYCEFVSTANPEIKAEVAAKFWATYEKLKWLEKLQFDVSIDFGSHLYETGGEVEIDYGNYNPS